MILLELDPNVVKPGWTPLLILIALALVMVFLFRSMRRQFRRVDDNFPEPAAPVGVDPDEVTASAEARGDVGDSTTEGEPRTTPPAPDERAHRV